MISLVLEGAIAPEKLPIRSPVFYDDLKIQAVLGNRVTGIDVEKRTVAVGNSSYGFDRLLIATGADPRPIKAEGAALGNISYMRNQDHVQTMLAGLRDARRALVLGGGLVGFKAAYGLLRRGLAVTMLIRSGYPLSMQVDEEAGLMIRDELVRHGLDVRVDIEAIAFGATPGSGPRIFPTAVGCRVTSWSSAKVCCRRWLLCRVTGSGPIWGSWSTGEWKPAWPESSPPEMWLNTLTSPAAPLGSTPFGPKPSTRVGSPV
jgi:hypothetical protein